MEVNEQESAQHTAWAASRWQAVRRKWNKWNFLILATLGAICPTLITLIVFDSIRHVEWFSYARDTGIYATVARFWEDGLIPYRDVHDFKPPMVYAALRVGYALWNYDIDSLRRVIMILSGGAALMLYGGLLRAGALVAAPLASLGFMTLMVVNPWGLPIDNTEALVAVFIAATIGCAAAHQGSGRWWWAVATGACLGLAVLSKHPAAVYALPAGAQLILWGPARAWSQRIGYAIRQILLMALGVSLVIGLTVLYFTWNGAVAAFYEALWVDAFRYSGNADFVSSRHFWTDLWARTPLKLRGVFQSDIWLFTTAVVLLVPVALLRFSRWVVIAFVWLVAAYVAVVVSPRGEDHYLVVALPAVALALAVLCEMAVPGPLRDTLHQSRNRLLAGVVIATLLFVPSWQKSYWPRRQQAAAVAPMYPSKLAGMRIHEAAMPGDTLYVESEPFDVYVYAGVRPACRFIYEDFAKSQTPRQEALQSKPTFIVVTITNYRRMHNPEVKGSSSPAYVLMLQRMLAESYEEWFVDRDVGAVFRLKDRTYLGTFTARPPNQTPGSR